MPIRFIAFLQIGLMVLILFRPFYPYLQYTLDKAYIAKNLCVKKEVKGNCCQGKCYLKKQVEKESANNDIDTKKQDKKQRTTELNDFVHTFFSVYFLTLLPFGYEWEEESLLFSGYGPSIYTPPQILFS